MGVRIDELQEYMARSSAASTHTLAVANMSLYAETQKCVGDVSRAGPALHGRVEVPGSSGTHVMSFGPSCCAMVVVTGCIPAFAAVLASTAVAPV